MKTLLVAPDLLKLEKVCLRPEAIVLVARTIRPVALCPRCQSPTRQVHSRYGRMVADLPWEGMAVRLELQTRKFFCRNDECPQRIFCERLPEVVERYARHTSRLSEALALIGFALGGEAGARASVGLGFPASPDTLLNRIRHFASCHLDEEKVKVLGVDDSAFRRGQRYGTIPVDQERHCVIDLLPDREAQTLAAWLTKHPEIEIVTRDRAPAYADGIRQGAPEAVQVADRWHILRNLTEALERWLGRQRGSLKQAAQAILPPPLAASSPAPASPKPPPRRQAVRDESREARLARYLEVRELYCQGASIKAIARHLGIHRRLVRLFVRADQYPERATPKKRRSKLDAYLPYLRRRWEEGYHNATELWREISGQGFHGAESLVRRVIRGWRAQLPPDLRCRRRLRSGPPPPKVAVPSPRTAAWLLVRAEEDLEEEERNFRAKLLEVCPEAGTALDLARRFQQLVGGRQVKEFEQWVAEAAKCGLPEIESFATGLGKDPAVRAALENRWSNGPVEGQVNRLKMIKRSMYGRAKFDLLRLRVLHSP